MQNKADELLTRLQETIKVEDKQKGYKRVETLHSFSDSVKEIALDSQLNMSLSTVKKFKLIIFNLTTKNIKTFFLWKALFLLTMSFLLTTIIYCSLPAPLILLNAVLSAVA